MENPMSNEPSARDYLRVQAILIVIAAVGWWLSTLCTADGQTVSAADAMGVRTERAPAVMPRSFPREEIPVVLARSAWGEAGELVSAGEIAAIHEVYTNRMRGSYQRTAWAYSAALRNRPTLQRLGRAPLTRGWPRIHREHWPRVLAAADDVVAGRTDHNCDARPLVHWGGINVDRAAIARLVRGGMVVANCPGYANTFLYRPQP